MKLAKIKVGSLLYIRQGSQTLAYRVLRHVIKEIDGDGNYRNNMVAIELLDTHKEIKPIQYLVNDLSVYRHYNGYALK